MKKIVLAVALLAFTIIVKAQTSFHFGFKAAPALAWLKTDSKGYEGNGSTFGFSYGLITEFAFTENYSFGTGINVTYRGGKIRGTTSIDSAGTKYTTTTDVAYNMKFIELPLTLKLKTKEIGVLKYYGQVGLSPGVIIKAKGDISSTSQLGNNAVSTFELNDEDFGDETNGFNLSMIIGAGVEYTISGNTVLLLGLQFDNGFLDVADGTQLNAISNYLGLNIGILF